MKKRNKIEFHVADKVVTADGITGDIIAVGDALDDIPSLDIPKVLRTYVKCTVRLEDGTIDNITTFDEENGYDRFYVIGNQVIGNTRENVLKYQIEKLEQQITEKKNRLIKLQNLKKVYGESIEKPLPFVGEV